MDAATKTPIADAAVFVLGVGTPMTSLTNAQGKLEFVDLQPGTYHIVVKAGAYLPSEPTEIEIGEGQVTTANVSLALELKVITTVRSRSSISVTRENMEQNQRDISSSLQSALGTLSGVQLNDTTYSNNSAFNISLNGQDASQTGYALNGVPIIGGAQMLGSAQSLFTGAGVDFSPTAGYMGGTVNAQTAQPTKVWSYQIIGKVGDFGTSTYSLKTTGTSGKFGLVFQGAQDTQDDPRSGLLYSDQSGEPYAHYGSVVSRAQMTRISYSANAKTSLIFTGLLTNNSTGYICSDFVTLAHCGLGSTPITSYHTAYGNIVLDTLIGNVALDASYGGLAQNTSASQGDRVLYGTPMSGYAYQSHYANRYLYGNAAISAGHHKLSFSVNEAAISGSNRQTYDGVPQTFANPNQQYTALNLTDRVEANPKLALSHTFGFADTTYSGSSVFAQETADWQPPGGNAYEASMTLGSASPFSQRTIPIDDPLSADYDCYNGSVYTDGPYDTGTKQSSIQYSLSWRRTLSNGFVSLYVFYNNQDGQSVRAAVPAASADPTLFPGGLNDYLGELQNVWAQPTVCGAIPFAPNRVYVSQSVVGLDRISGGVNLNGQFGFGRRLRVAPSLSLQRAYFASLDPRLEAVGSYYAIGTQIPHAPYVTGNLTISGVIGPSSVDWGVIAQYQSLNNPYNQPAYTTITAGITANLQNGSSLTFAESNVFNTDANLFGTYQGIYPMPVVGGGTYAFSTSPLRPRQWSVSWRIPWHQHVSPPAKPPVKPIAPKANPMAAPAATAKP